MSSPTTRSATPPGGGRTPHEITNFVAAVRAHLDDLSADEVTELTGGLEADLTDGLAEAGSMPSQLHGDPGEYADELRAAAGLPPRGAAGVPRADRPGPGLAVGLEQTFVLPARERVQDVIQRLDAKPWWPGVRDFLVVLRPAWWVVRAWVAVEALFMLGGVGDSAVRGGFGGLVLLIAAIVVSVQLARNSPLEATWQRVLVAAWNLCAVLLLLPLMFMSAGSDSRGYANSVNDVSEPPGLSIDGRPVSNVFPYDSAGRPLTGVQLYDQDGQPLEVSEDSRSSFYDEQTQTSVELVPGSPPGSAPRWNAFPLQQRRYDDASGSLGPIESPRLPLSGVPPLTASQGPTPTATGIQVPTATPQPSRSVSSTAVPTTNRPVKPDPTETK